MVRTPPRRDGAARLTTLSAALVAALLTSSTIARADPSADALADAAAAATVAVQAVERTVDGRARVVECSGALIATDLVLTAGHCLDGATGPAQVAAFAYRDGQPIPSPLRATAFARHPDHVLGWRLKAGDPETRAREIAADLALIRLAAPVAGAKPIGLLAIRPTAAAASSVGAVAAGGPSGRMKRLKLSSVRASSGTGATVLFATSASTVCGGDSGGPAVSGADGAAALWGVMAAVLKPRGGCGTRIAITPVDPSSEGLKRMRTAVGAP